MPEEFLVDTFAKELEGGAVSFTNMASLGEEQDSDIDPSQQQRNERPQVALGTVTVTANGGDACKNTNFDPNMMSSGFTPSADPVLRMRSPSYAISFGKRLSNQQSISTLPVNSAASCIIHKLASSPLYVATKFHV